MFSFRRWFAARMLAQAALDEAKNHNNRNNNLSRLFGSLFSQNGSQNLLNRHDTLLQFYYADEELTMISSELDTFDGRRDPSRCTNLVNQLRAAQDKVITLLFRLMDEWNCERASRDFRIKFPDDILVENDNGESLNGQIWFGAECLAAGSNIMNHDRESEYLRPIAKNLTIKIDQLRLELKHFCTDLEEKLERIGLDLMLKLEQFDRIFADFEYEYVKTMMPIKSIEEIQQQQDLMVLFSETVQSALERKLLSQDEFDECEPTVIINIPRLAIIHGLVRCGMESPILRRNKKDLSPVFKPFHSRLLRIHSLLQALRPVETEFLERLLINKECSANELNSFSWNKDIDMIAEHQLALRRYSDPCFVSAEDNSSSKNQNEEPENSTMKPLKRCFSSISFMHLTSSNVNSDATGNLDQYNRCVKGSDDNVSVATTATNSTVDSFEIALAVGAKHSHYMSPGSKELLHNLFVSIAGIADQLQSNYASEMRTILQNVYTIHCSSSDDNESYEEALEAHSDSHGGESSGLSSTTRSPSETVDSNLSSACNHSDDDPSSSNQTTYLPYGGRESESDSLTPHAHSQLLIPPIWVPDELASVCTSCFSPFTLIRRRHHCRNCGGIYCNNCCNHYVPLVHYGFYKPVRVCRLCFSSLQQS
ncbi:lateral signaling target protein 2 isoform X2 [Brevipalpus obovatus]|uniref:lateral signaling target protein 2 isoform X2 n=1 Tax=Brevipalpus obovatus TaxID=246614 RepID=UPI003D9F6E25